MICPHNPEKNFEISFLILFQYRGMPDEFRTYTYRRPLTPGGLRDIEKGTLEGYSPEMYANFNTGVLEQYLDEEARKKSFGVKQWIWKKVLVGIIIGVIFAIINQYVGLKVGMIVAGNWYLVYVLGMALRWKQNEVNISSGASTGASATCTGFVFTFPAIYLLAYSARYAGKGGTTMITPEMIPSIATAYIAVLLAGIFGVLLFIIFRKIWLLDDPLPVPGFEATIKLLDIVNDISTGAMKRAMKSLKIVLAWTGISMLITFLKDFPMMPAVSDAAYAANQDPKRLISIFDYLFAKSRWYLKGRITQPYEADTSIYTHIDFAISPMMFAIGWFMKLRSAFLVAAGSLLTWVVVIPVSMLMNVSVYVPKEGVYKNIMDPFFLHPSFAYTPAIAAYAEIGIPLAIGAILGGGITALLKMSKIFGSCFKDIMALRTAERRDLIRDRGWFEWPYSHLPISAIIMILGVPLVLIISGYPPLQSILLSIVLFSLTMFLSAIAVKVMGEVRTTPVSGTSFIMLLALVGALRLIGTDPQTTLIMALLGTTIFGTTCSLAADITSDFKAGLYCGTKPYYLIKGEISAMVPGAAVAIIGASILSYGLATGELDLLAPQAHAFAKFSQVIMGGEAPLLLLGIGFLIGVVADLLTGMGTSFGLGMYFPLSTSLVILLGGSMRTIWEKYSLEPKAKRFKWDEKEKTLHLIDTYMAGTGLIMGEAILGTIIALCLVIPLLTG